MIYYDNSNPENPLCNINDLLENVNFREVTLEILSEFYLKYNHFKGIDQKFIGNVSQIFKENHLDKIMIHCSKKLKIKLMSFCNEEGDEEMISRIKAKFLNNSSISSSLMPQAVTFSPFCCCSHAFMQLS